MSLKYLALYNSSKCPTRKKILKNENYIATLRRFTFIHFNILLINMHFRETQGRAFENFKTRELNLNSISEIHSRFRLLKFKKKIMMIYNSRNGAIFAEVLRKSWIKYCNKKAWSCVWFENSEVVLSIWKRGYFNFIKTSFPITYHVLGVIFFTSDLFR